MAAELRAGLQALARELYGAPQGTEVALMTTGERPMRVVEFTALSSQLDDGIGRVSKGWDEDDHKRILQGALDLIDGISMFRGWPTGGLTQAGRVAIGSFMEEPPAFAPARITRNVQAIAAPPGQ